jgi:hypothetical protein
MYQRDLATVEEVDEDLKMALTCACEIPNNGSLIRELLLLLWFALITVIANIR